MRNQIIQGSVLDPETWAAIPDQHVQCCITSPPYWGLRDYGVEGQLGLEKTPEEYVGRMVDVFSHLWRILRDDGTLWLNLGDSYNSAKSNKSGDNGYNDGRKNRSSRFSAGGAPNLKTKELCGIPWRVALALQADGWYLRQDIIWHKPNPMPESCRDRCTKAHEYLFLLTKKPRYFCDMEAIREPATYAGKKRGGSTNRYEQNLAGMDNKVYNTRNKRDVWSVSTAPYPKAHFATFPPKLIEPCVLAGTSEAGGCRSCGSPFARVVKKVPTGQTQKMADGWDTGSGGHGTIHREGREAGEAGKPVMANQTVSWKQVCNCDTPQAVPQIVFDPFFGSGTTGMVAKQHGRDYLGMELNPEYIELATKRINDTPEPLFT